MGDGVHVAEDPTNPKVGMLDLTDQTLHLCGAVHMTTRCGIRLDQVTVGPFAAVQSWAERQCTECFIPGEV